MMNRRDFLIGSATLALTACARGPMVLLPRPARARYAVVTQSMYWSSAQDFREFGTMSSLSVPGLPPPDDSRPFSVLTTVNDDGSGLRRLKIPMHYHCVAAGPSDELLYLVGNQRPSALVALDSRTLEVVSVVPAGTGIERTFGGHGVRIPGTSHMAFTMNGFQRGSFDFISIRDARTLKEVECFSSHGFQVHEIRLCGDEKNFVCGHYGSYLGQGPYAGLGIYGSQGGYSMNRAPKLVYPASVTLVEAGTGRLRRILSDRRAGQEGHADADEHADEAYLPNLPARLESRPNLEAHPRFREGENQKKDGGEFAVTDHSVGISVAYDSRYREILVPHRGELTIYVTAAATNQRRDVFFRDQLSAGELAWLQPTSDFLNGLAFHPDGKHYVVSTSNGFLVLERGTHRVNHGLSFPLAMKVHSHLAVFRA